MSEFFPAVEILPDVWLGDAIDATNQTGHYRSNIMQPIVTRAFTLTDENGVISITEDVDGAIEISQDNDIITLSSKEVAAAVVNCLKKLVGDGSATGRDSTMVR